MKRTAVCIVRHSVENEGDYFARNPICVSYYVSKVLMIRITPIALSILMTLTRGDPEKLIKI